MSSTKAKPKGVIDSLGEGFTLVFRRPYLLALPIALEVILWNVPRVKATPLFSPVIDAFTSFSGRGASPDQLLQLNSLTQQTTNVLDSVNLLAMLSWHLPKLASLGLQGGGKAVEVDSWPELLGIALALAAGAVLAGCLFLQPFAFIIREGTVTTRKVLHSLRRGYVRFAVYLATVAVIGTVILLATGVLAAVGFAAVPVLSTLFVLIALVAALLLSFYLFFGEEAVFVGELGGISAIRESCRLVRTHFWSVAGLFLLIIIISQGLGVVWLSLTRTLPGLYIAILGNSFIGTGVAAAVMVYYREASRPVGTLPAHAGENYD
jgi:hypothetical protein